MRSCRLFSVVVNNYNYGRFLRDAIDSALNQTCPNREVIVVDDGSDDSSREIIALYGDAIIPVLKENGGQASAFNAGFAASHGDVVLFLDADDVLLPTALEAIMQVTIGPDSVKVHWPLRVVDEQGRPTGDIYPSADLPSGDLRDLVRRDGPDTLVFPPTSGNAWMRWFVEAVLPIPPDLFSIAADAYLGNLAPFCGVIERLPDPISLYRVHASSHSRQRPFEDAVREHAARVQEVAAVAASRFLPPGADISSADWADKSWFQRIARSLDDILRLVRPGGVFALLDEDAWGAHDVIAGRQRIPFPVRNGKYAGRPADSRQAIAAVEGLLSTGATHIVIAWPAFWWLDYYTGFHEYLQASFRRVLQTDRLIAFELPSGQGV